MPGSDKVDLMSPRNPKEALPTLTTLQNAATANGNGTALNVDGYGGVIVHISGTFSATINFEATIEDSDAGWEAVEATRLNDRSVGSTTTQTGLYYVPLPGAAQFRAPVSGYASGNVTVKARPVASAPGVEGDVQLAVSDIEIGAVELKDAETDTRAKVTASAAAESDAGAVAKVAAIGARDDTAATSDTGSFSLIALWKRFLDRLTNGNWKIQIRGGAKGSTAAADVTSESVDADTQALHVAVKGTTTVGGTVTADQGAAGAQAWPVDVTDEANRDLGKVDIVSLDQYTPADVDTGAGTDNALPVAIRLPTDGGGVNAPGDVTNGLDVDVTRLPDVALSRASSISTASPTAVGTTSAQLVAANANRRELYIQNVGTADIYLELGDLSASTSNYHIALKAASAADKADGGYVWLDRYTGAVQAIAGASGGKVSFYEA